MTQLHYLTDAKRVEKSAWEHLQRNKEKLNLLCSQLNINLCDNANAREELFAVMHNILGDEGDLHNMLEWSYYLLEARKRTVIFLEAYSAEEFLTTAYRFDSSFAYQPDDILILLAQISETDNVGKIKDNISTQLKAVVQQKEELSARIEGVRQVVTAEREIIELNRRLPDYWAQVTTLTQDLQSITIDPSLVDMPPLDVISELTTQIDNLEKRSEQLALELGQVTRYTI